MKKFGLVLFGFVLGVIVTFPFVPEISFSPHTVDVQLVVSSDATSPNFHVTHVVDGDTIDVQDDIGSVQRIRFIGIDTPETVDPRKSIECEGPEASARMKELVLGATVTLERKPDEDTDQYGRFLRYVFLDGNDIGAQMIREGYAVSVCKKYPHPKCDLYDELEQKAIQEKLGRWSACAK